VCACVYYSKSQLASRSSLERFIMSLSFQVALTPFPHAHSHTDQPTDRPPTYTTAYIGFPAFSKLLEHSRAFQASRALPTQRHSRHPIQGQDLGHPASASLRLGRLKLATARCCLSPTQNTVACRQLGKLLTLETFRDHTLLYMTLYSSVASPVA